MSDSYPDRSAPGAKRVWVTETCSPEATEQVGAWLGAVLPDGCVVALYGDLAVGKTCLTRGMATTFGAAAVHSPTFTLENRYGSPPRQLIHIDLYRLPGPSALSDLGWEESLEPDAGLCVIEWADRAREWLPPFRIDVYLYHAGENRRRIEIHIAHPGIQLPETPTI